MILQLDIYRDNGNMFWARLLGQSDVLNMNDQAWMFWNVCQYLLYG